MRGPNKGKALVCTKEDGGSLGGCIRSTEGAGKLATGLETLPSRRLKRGRSWASSVDLKRIGSLLNISPGSLKISK